MDFRINKNESNVITQIVHHDRLIPMNGGGANYDNDCKANESDTRKADTSDAESDSEGDNDDLMLPDNRVTGSDNNNLPLLDNYGDNAENR